MTPSLYICFMSNKANGTKTPGVEVPIEIDQISKWLERDLAAMASLIDAIRGDKELRDYMATWFHGRMLNAKNLQKLQEELSNVQ